MREAVPPHIPHFLGFFSIACPVGRGKFAGQTLNRKAA